jgi:hypothetical protein
VCSIECKHSQINGLAERRTAADQGGSAASEAPLQTSPTRPPRALAHRALPQSYSTVGEVKHGKAVLAVALGRSAQGQSKRPVLYTAGEGLLRAWEGATGIHYPDLPHVRPLMKLALLAPSFHRVLLTGCTTAVCRRGSSKAKLRCGGSRRGCSPELQNQGVW